MFPLLTKIVLFTFLSLSLAVNCYADKRGSEWYDKKAEGWFFYKDPKEIPQPKKEEPKPAPQETHEEAEQISEPPEIVTGSFGKKDNEEASEADKTDNGPKQGSSAWIKANLPKVLNIAIDAPTEKNVKRAAYLHKEMERKANKFSEMWVTVHSLDPKLDANNMRPSTSTMKDVTSRRILSNRKKLLKKMSADVGFVFFFDVSHPFSVPMAINVENVARIHNLDVLPVSKDGKDLGLHIYTEPEKDNGQIARLGIKNLPAVYMYVKKTREWIPISENYLNTSDFEFRILRHAHHYKVITDQEFNSTRDIENPDTYYENTEQISQSESQTETAKEKDDPYKDYFEKLIGEGA